MDVVKDLCDFYLLQIYSAEARGDVHMARIHAQAFLYSLNGFDDLQGYIPPVWYDPTGPLQDTWYRILGTGIFVEHYSDRLMQMVIRSMRRIAHSRYSKIAAGVVGTGALAYAGSSYITSNVDKTRYIEDTLNAKEAQYVTRKIQNVVDNKTRPEEFDRLVRVNMTEFEKEYASEIEQVGYTDNLVPVSEMAVPDNRTDPQQMARGEDVIQLDKKAMIEQIIKHAPNITDPGELVVEGQRLKELNETNDPKVQNYSNQMVDTGQTAQKNGQAVITPEQQQDFKKATTTFFETVGNFAYKAGGALFQTGKDTLTSGAQTFYDFGANTGAKVSDVAGSAVNYFTGSSDDSAVANNGEAAKAASAATDNDKEKEGEKKPAPPYIPPTLPDPPVHTGIPFKEGGLTQIQKDSMEFLRLKEQADGYLQQVPNKANHEHPAYKEYLKVAKQMERISRPYTDNGESFPQVPNPGAVELGDKFTLPEMTGAYNIGTPLMTHAETTVNFQGDVVKRDKILDQAYDEYTKMVEANKLNDSSDTWAQFALQKLVDAGILAGVVGGSAMGMGVPGMVGIGTFSTTAKTLVGEYYKSKKNQRQETLDSHPGAFAPGAQRTAGAGSGTTGTAGGGGGMGRTTAAGDVEDIYRGTTLLEQAKGIQAASGRNPEGATLRAAKFGVMPPQTVIPDEEEQLRSDIQFDMFSVVQPGYGEGATNKLFLEQEWWKDQYTTKGRPYTHRPWLGNLNYAHPMPWQWQEIQSESKQAEYKRFMEMMRQRDQAYRASRGAASINAFGYDNCEVPVAVSSKGLKRRRESPFEPAIHNRQPFMPVYMEPGVNLRTRDWFHPYSARRVPWRKEASYDNGMQHLPRRNALEVVLP